VIRDVLEESLRAAFAKLHDEVGIDPPGSIALERPARREHGDWSSNVALVTAKPAGQNPRELATRLAEVLNADPAAHVERVEVAGPGFVNFHLAPTWLHDVLQAVITQGEADYGRHTFGAGTKVQLEFVSANPTGPIHVGNGWFASYGDAVARLLERCGYDVSREYYVNDTGGQIRLLGASVLARRAGLPVPDGGYPSGFVKGLASAYDGPEDVRHAGRWAAEHILRFIRTQMEAINITFDEWFSAASIQESDAVADTVALLRERGLVWEEDGALWLDTGAFGDHREKRVLRKSESQGGDYTYLAEDIAYHRNKFLERGFDLVIDVWGADHQGQVPSLLAGVEALGIEKGRLEIRIGQMVALTSGRIGKRLGNAVDLDDLVDDIGADVMRLLSLVSSIDQSPTVDLDEVRSQSKESPVYYVQYAHARIHSIGNKARELGVTRSDLSEVSLAPLTHEREVEVLRTLSTLPEVVEVACGERAPHKVTAWVRELADRFHGFYSHDDCRILGDGVPPETTQARLWLVEGTRIGLAVGLGLLGVSAPESM
jgi:arginyl-tRNA synthetase